MPFDLKRLDNFPTDPGVYVMKNSAGAVLYVGKANNLRRRVRQYFMPGRDLRTIIPYLVAKVEQIDILVVLSEKEALLLENTLIKQHQPKYNALLKDDKTYVALKVTTKQQWPVLSLVRLKGKPKADAAYFGPYTSGLAARKTFDLLNRLFPLRQCSDQEFARRTRPCILYDMKRCLGPCVKKCTPEAYQQNVDRTVQFLRGHDQEIVKDLYKEMDLAAASLEFEKAAAVLKTIRQIESTLEKQFVDTPLGSDSDALGIFRQGDEVVLSKMVCRSGKLRDVCHYNFKQIADEDAELLASFLLQHYREQADLPHEILLPTELAPGEAEALAEILSENKKRKVNLVVPEKGAKFALIKMALANASATFKKEHDASAAKEKALNELQSSLNLSCYPQRIECFDNSNIAGTEAVSVMVAFTDGQKDSSRYRKYKIKAADPTNDYALMQEVLSRRYKRAIEENNLPDLILIDGGKGHLNIALKVLAELNIVTVSVIAVAKESGRHDKGMSAEQVFLPNHKDPILLRHTSPALFLLQQIRDEAHRFAITFHRKRRSKGLLTSEVDEIPGIGKVKKGIILRYFGSLKRLKEATLEDLQKISGISEANIQSLWKFIHK